jgi:arginase
MAATIPGFHAIDPARCVLVDARDLDPDEKVLLEALPVHHVQCADAAGEAAKLRMAGSRRAHLHVDLDVHNPDELQANRYTKAGGPGVDEVRQAVAGICRAVPVAGVTISAYDPVFDAKAEVPPVVGALLVEMLTALERI